jgi:hypothetical protein
MGSCRGIKQTRDVNCEWHVTRRFVGVRDIYSSQEVEVARTILPRVRDLPAPRRRGLSGVSGGLSEVSVEVAWLVGSGATLSRRYSRQAFRFSEKSGPLLYGVLTLSLELNPFSILSQSFPRSSAWLVSVSIALRC